MTAEGPMPPVSGFGGGGLGGCEKPPRIQAHWWDIMSPLPAQVLRPLRDTLDRRFTLAHRRCHRNHARDHLDHYIRDLQEWMDSVDAMMQRHGEPFVDKLDGAQAEAFHASLTDSERKALAKCQSIRAAIAYAGFALQRIEWELSNE